MRVSLTLTSSCRLIILRNIILNFLFTFGNVFPGWIRLISVSWILCPWLCDLLKFWDTLSDYVFNSFMGLVLSSVVYCLKLSIPVYLVFCVLCFFEFKVLLFVLFCIILIEIFSVFRFWVQYFWRYFVKIYFDCYCRLVVMIDLIYRLWQIYHPFKRLLHVDTHMYC